MRHHEYRCFADSLQLEPTEVTSDLIRFRHPYTHQALYAFGSKARASAPATALARGHELPP